METVISTASIQQTNPAAGGQNRLILSMILQQNVATMSNFSICNLSGFQHTNGESIYVSVNSPLFLTSYWMEPHCLFFSNGEPIAAQAYSYQIAFSVRNAHVANQGSDMLIFSYNSITVPLTIISEDVLGVPNGSIPGKVVIPALIFTSISQSSALANTSNT
eukprot:762583-Hanusia_phi.AAC.1